MRDQCPDPPRASSVLGGAVPTPLVLAPGLIDRGLVGTASLSRSRPLDQPTPRDQCDNDDDDPPEHGDLLSSRVLGAYLSLLPTSGRSVTDGA